MAFPRATLLLIVVVLCVTNVWVRAQAYTGSDASAAAAEAEDGDLLRSVSASASGSGSGVFATNSQADTATTTSPTTTAAATTAASTTTAPTIAPTVASTPEPTPSATTTAPTTTTTVLTEEVTVAAPVTTAPPLTLPQKKELCQRDYKNYNRVLRLLRVDPQPRGGRGHVAAVSSSSASSSTSLTALPPTAKYPRIFCYVNTISPYHKTHAQLVADTWAQRCDKTVFFSNTTGTLWVNKGTPQENSFDIIKMNAPADYHHLWMKHKEVVQYIHDHFRHEYDWFYKADDDAYVIVDNLRNYLKRPEIVMNHKRQPMHLGKRLNLTADGTRGLNPHADLRDKWWSQFDRWVFNSGGPGYAMNRLFIDKFVASMPNKNCLSRPEAERLPEDTSTTFCMMWHGVVPWDTRDLKGRPRWHVFDPELEYGWEPEEGKTYWFHEYNQHIGGYKWGDDCCAPDSIGFHYVKKKAMHHMERMLYFCRSGDEITDMEAYNTKYSMSTSHGILQF